MGMESPKTPEEFQGPISFLPCTIAVGLVLVPAERRIFLSPAREAGKANPILGLGTSLSRSLFDEAFLVRNFRRAEGRTNLPERIAMVRTVSEMIAAGRISASLNLVQSRSISPDQSTETLYTSDALEFPNGTIVLDRSRTAFHRAVNCPYSERLGNPLRNTVQSRPSFDWGYIRNEP